MESPNKKTRYECFKDIHSKESREKWNQKRKQETENNKKFIAMILSEFLQSSISKKNILQFLFKLAGYDFNSETFQIIQRPSKFGGIWKEVQQPIGKQISEQFQTSLLENNRFIKFVHQPLCDKCGAIW